MLRAPDIDAMVPTPVRVRRRKVESRDTFTLELDSADSGFGFEPGQFNMLYVFGVGEVPISISGDPTDDRKLVHTTRRVGAVTEALAGLRRGDSLGVRGPFGRGWPVPASGDVVLVAGGVGLAPLRPALYEILSRRDDYGRILLLYGARSSDDVLFRSELERWQSRHSVEVLVTVDRAVGTWPGRVGVVTTLIDRAEFDVGHARALVCGPTIMMSFCATALIRRGMPPEAIFVSLERNMKCAIGLCGHCQFGPSFLCKDGPVFSYADVRQRMSVREL